MSEELTPHFVNLVYEAALKSFWRRRTLAKFLRQCGIAEAFVAGWTPDESKRDLLDRLFERLSTAKQGHSVILRMGRFLGEQTSFPDLEGWENTRLKVAEATTAVTRLKTALDQRERTAAEEEAQLEARGQFAELMAEAARSRDTLDKLRERLDGLATQMGTQKAGYDFQDWFYDLADFFEIQNRRPYTKSGREIDGSITLSGTTYLVELKFTRDQAGAPDVDIFNVKVTDKADNTMGVMVSMSGYSSVAIEGASGRRTPLLLIDYAHLYLVLGGAWRLDALIERVRRHASQTGEAYLPVDRMSG